MTDLDYRYVVDSSSAMAAHVDRDCPELTKTVNNVKRHPVDEVDTHDCQCVYEARVPALEDDRAEFHVADFIVLFIAVLVAIFASVGIVLMVVVPP